MERRYYNDIINERKVEFLSDAEQSFIDSLEFNGDWWTVKGILMDWGFMVMELDEQLN